MSDRVNSSDKPLVGGNYAGVWDRVTGSWISAPTNQPGWRRHTEGIAVGWLDPTTDAIVPPVHRSGIGAGS